MRDQRQLILNIQPEASPRFDNYLPGDNLEVLLALEYLARGELRETILYVWGAPGMGRSHLLKATVAEAQRFGRTAHYVGSGAALPVELPQLLAVDDVDQLDTEAQVRVFSQINQIRETGAGALLVAGPCAPTQLALREDLASRLSWGLVFALRPLGEADRIVAVRERAASLGLELSEEVMHYLLAHGRRDLPSLLACVDDLDVRSLSLKRPVTVPMVRDCLSDRAAHKA